MASCVGCKFLFLQDKGYSNYTVEETEVHCLLGLNSKLPDQQPWDGLSDENDLWEATRNGRCSHYGPGPQVRLDVDGETTYRDFDLHPDVAAIWFAKEKLSE